MIELKSVSKAYQQGAQLVHAVHDVDLSVQAGEIFGIIGASGAGKSTLLRCMNILEKPTQGEVLVDKQSLLHLSALGLRAARRRMGMVFQHFNLLSTKTVFENVALPLRFQTDQSIDAAGLRTKVQSLLKLVGLSDRADAYPGQLSGGQKQRVAIARALVTEPSVLLCDEMTSSLDPEMTASILKLVKRINKEMGVTIVLITHEMDVIKQIADRVAVMDQGRVVECGDIVTVFQQPKQAITQNLIRSTLQLDLPESLQKQLQAAPAKGLHPIVRILFFGAATNKPIMSELMLREQVHLNIMQASMDYLHGETMGIMLVKVEGNDKAVQSTLQYLQEQGVQSEIVGYL